MNKSNSTIWRNKIRRKMVFELIKKIHKMVVMNFEFDAILSRGLIKSYRAQLEKINDRNKFIKEYYINALKSENRMEAFNSAELYCNSVIKFYDRMLFWAKDKWYSDSVNKIVSIKIVDDFVNYCNAHMIDLFAVDRNELNIEIEKDKNFDSIGEVFEAEEE